MSNCPKCATDVAPESLQCHLCGAHLEQPATPAHIKLIEVGMALVGAAAIAFILETFAPAGLRISVWLADVPLSALVYLVYLAGTVGAVMIAIGYGSRLFRR